MKPIYWAANIFSSTVLFGLICAIGEKFGGPQVVSRDFIFTLMLLFTLGALLLDRVWDGKVLSRFVENDLKLRFYVNSFWAVALATFILARR